MSKPAAKTGIGPIVLAAIEQFFPTNQRILEDDLAYRILPFGMRAFVRLMRLQFMRDWMVRASDKNIPGIWSGMMCRKRYIDEKLAEAAGGIDAVINLGAGFDTRAYRLPALRGKPVWELDQQENIRPKQARLRQVFGSIPSNVRLVTIDFDREELGTVLQSQGYSDRMKTFFIWEAVTQYLTEAGIRSTFEFLAEAEPGSSLVFTYIRKDFLDGRDLYHWEKAYEKYVEKEKIWRFGMNPEEWPGFLQQYGWKPVEDIGYDELAEMYVRPTGRALPSTQVERIVHAQKL